MTVIRFVFNKHKWMLAGGGFFVEPKGYSAWHGQQKSHLPPKQSPRPGIVQVAPSSIVSFLSNIRGRAHLTFS